MRLANRYLDLMNTEIQDTPRSNRADVRNPLLAIPEVREQFEQLPPEARKALEAVLRSLSKNFRVRAEKAWKTRKPPLAQYWAVNAVNARHLALAVRKATKD